MATDIAKSRPPALPVDENGRVTAGLVLPITNAEGEIIGWSAPQTEEGDDGTLRLVIEATVVSPTANVNVEEWGGTPQTGADLTPLFQHLDVDLSTIASELTLSAIFAQLDVPLSDLATEATLQSVLAALASPIDVNVTNSITISDVEVNNGPGAAAVNIQDGGNSITVDGTVAATQSGAWDITDITGTISLPTGAATETTLAAILAQLDVPTSDLATEATLATMLTLAGFEARINTLGQKTMANSTPVVLASDQTVIPVSMAPATSGGLSIYRNIDLDETGVTAKASAGQLFGYYISNNASTVMYVKVYNMATNPTSSDTPVLTLPIPAQAAANIEFSNGVAFATGIALRATTGVADNNNVGPAANEVVVNILYK